MKKLTLVLFALIVSASLFADNFKGSIVKNGNQVPQFEITTLDGAKFNVADFKGKVVLINFFATWCGPCMKELPQVKKYIWKEFKDKDFAMISIGRGHKAEELRKWNKRRKFPFPIAADPKREVYDKFATQYIPRTFILDKNGKIVFQEVGFDQEKLKHMIKAVKDNL
jgi:peroxiredoxin